MTVINPEPAGTSKMEPKVKWATVGSYVAGVIGLLLTNLLTGHDNELISATIPDWLESFLLPILPAAIALLSGYQARHQWRVRPNARGGATGSTELG